MNGTVDTILFVYSEQPAIDRGWDPRDVKAHLMKIGFKVWEITINDRRDAALPLSDAALRAIVWPVCYTMGSCVDGPLLVQLLEDLGIPYVGSKAKALRYNSKILLKQALVGTGVSSPRFHVFTSIGDEEVGFEVPYMLKCEYSCDSNGVAVIRSPEQLTSTRSSLETMWGQRVFAEEWARNREYTVAFIPANPRPIVAPIEMTIRSGEDYISNELKTDNRRLVFSLPPAPITEELRVLTEMVAEQLDIDGYFRMDVLQDQRGMLQVIDLNFLVQLHLWGEDRSYFPVALEMCLGMTPERVVETILDQALCRFSVESPPLAKRLKMQE